MDAFFFNRVRPARSLTEMAVRRKQCFANTCLCLLGNACVDDWLNKLACTTPTVLAYIVKLIAQQARRTFPTRCCIWSVRGH